MFNHYASFRQFLHNDGEISVPVKIIRLLIFLLILPAFSKAQNQDSLKTTITQSAAARFAEPKPFSLEYKRVDAFNFSSKLNGQDLPEQRTSSWSQFSAGANLTIPLNKRLLLQASVFYRFTSAKANISPSTPLLQELYDNDHHYHTEGLGLLHFSKLFGKTAIYSAGVYADGSEKAYERIRGMVSGTIVLKADVKTKMNVGLMVSTDPSVLFPVFPVFVYQRKLNNNFMADIMLPRYVYLRKQMFCYGRLSAGAELDGQSTFFLYNIDQTGKTYQYRQVDVDLGLLYEHLLPGNFTLSFRSGYRLLPYARVFDKSLSFEDYLFDVKADPAPYFNIGLSFNPFAKRNR